MQEMEKQCAKRSVSAPHTNTDKNGESYELGATKTGWKEQTQVLQI